MRSGWWAGCLAGWLVRIDVQKAKIAKKAMNIKVFDFRNAKKAKMAINLKAFDVQQLNNVQKGN